MRSSCVVSLIAVAFFSAVASDAHGQVGSPDPVEAAGCTRLVDFETAEWRGRPQRVTHPLLPLIPGTQRVFEGRSNVTGAPLPHRVTFTVTRLTKVVDGVRTRVVWDVDEADGEVTEAELAVFAQDRAGNVWNLGEYPEEYDGDTFTGAPNTWFAGVGSAEPGIHMPAVPEVGLPEYLQGWVREVEFLDCATIFETGATIEVPAGSFSDVLITHERSPLDPEGGVQVKYHAPGVGIVNIAAIDDPEGETLELVEFNTLSDEQLQEANREAHILDQRGLQCSAVYAQTTPVEGPDDGDYGPYSCPVPPPPPFAGVTTPAPFSITPPPAAAPSRPEQPRRRGYRASVDHPLFPLERGREMIFKGREDDVAIRVESRVRDARVRVAGVLATAVDVEEREDGVLVERATDYYAQDRKGDVWYLGERVDNIENGRVVDHDGQWIAGRKGARRGLFLPAVPEVGQSFRQTRAPGVSKDRSTVVSLDAKVSTAAGRFTGCLKTRDTDLLSRRRRAEHKFYCPDVGLVRERQADGTVDLVEFG
jgi:hypothetical protein